MADTNVANFTATTGIRATIDALLNTRRALTRAASDLERQAGLEIIKRTDAFAAAASKSGVNGADALKQDADLEAAKTLFKNQAVALDHWERATADRLTGLAEENQEVVVQALDAQLAVLRQQVSEERSQVAEVKSVISEFEELRAQLKRAAAKNKP